MYVYESATPGDCEFCQAGAGSLLTFASGTRILPGDISSIVILTCAVNLTLLAEVLNWGVPAPR